MFVLISSDVGKVENADEKEEKEQKKMVKKIMELILLLKWKEKQSKYYTVNQG